MHTAVPLLAPWQAHSHVHYRDTSVPALAAPTTLKQTTHNCCWQHDTLQTSKHVPAGQSSYYKLADYKSLKPIFFWWQARSLPVDYGKVFNLESFANLDAQQAHYQSTQHVIGNHHAVLGRQTCLQADSQHAITGGL